MLDTVNLVFAADEKYLKYTNVTLASILKNYSGTQEIKVYLLLDGPLSLTNKEKFEYLKLLHDYEYYEIVVNAEKFSGVKTSDGISIATYYRLLMHHFLPKSCEKVLYLDSDLIIKDSIDELFNIDISEYLFGGVEDSISLDYNNKFGMPSDAANINAGVLLVNVKMMRDIGFDEIVAEYLTVNKYRVTLGDQQILVECFYDKIMYVPVKWNVHGSMFVAGWAEKYVSIRNNMQRDEAENAIACPSIIHYTLKRKPWISLEHPRAEEWYDYLPFTAYTQEVSKPEQNNKEKIKKTEKPSGVWHFLRVVIPMTIKSFLYIRKSRIKIESLQKRIKKVENRKISGGFNLPAPAGGFNYTNHLGISLKMVLQSRQGSAGNVFVASDYVKSLGTDLSVMSNVTREETDGGYAENLKTIFKSSNFTFADGIPDLVLVTSQRVAQGRFWKCIETAYLYERPLLFAEVAMFAGFASYFDSEATLKQRRVLGFIFDDLGYYFDARQPSRFEATLNDSGFELNEGELARAANAIRFICSNGITKYNKYTKESDFIFEESSKSVLVIEQKKGDAAIQFAAAKDSTFVDMIDAAIRENPDKTIYLKRHPDGIVRDKDDKELYEKENLVLLPDNVSINEAVEACCMIYTVTSQVGFEALLRKKKVVTFGMPFYAGWGLTDDRVAIPRRQTARSVEELFYVSAIQNSIYVDPDTGNIIELEKALEIIMSLRREMENQADVH